MTSDRLKLLLAEYGLRPIDLARKCEVNKSTVARWDEHGIPLKRVFQIEKETGIPRTKLRPDFFTEAAQ
jgi:hypothetical protein